jgi:ParB-like chromosome segregation protein Spo0J
MESLNVPVLVDADHKVIAGHGRVMACQRLGGQRSRRFVSTI